LILNRDSQERELKKTTSSQSKLSRSRKGRGKGRESMGKLPSLERLTINILLGKEQFYTRTLIHERKKNKGREELKVILYLRRGGGYYGGESKEGRK